MNELINSIKAQMYDRTTSPLSGSFILSWTLWNYKMIFVLFSSLGVVEKFDYISGFLYASWKDFLIIGLLYPLLTTFFFIFVYPYPARFAYEFWRNRQKELKEIRQKIEDETPLTMEESREIRHAVMQLEADYARELERKENEIRRLREEIDIKSTLIPENSSGAEEHSSDENKSIIDIQNDHLDILQIIAKFGGNKVPKKNILTKSTHNTVKSEYYLGQLHKDGYVSSFYSRANKDFLYSLTQRGRKLLIENKLD